MTKLENYQWKGPEFLLQALFLPPLKKMYG